MSRRTAVIRLFAAGIAASLAEPFPAEADDNPATLSSRKPMNLNPRLYSFIGGDEGSWRVTSQRTLLGDSLPAVKRLEVIGGDMPLPMHAGWKLRGVTSNERYVTRPEKDQLLAKQPPLGRPEADCAVLIPIRKNSKWWGLTQDERGRIFESESHHTRIGLDYLPAIARRLHHCRDLSETEPFDFLTWFEFAQKDTPDFDRLLEKLRASEEWSYVDREVEVRVTHRLP